MYLEIFLADFAVFRVFLGISWDFAEIPEFRGSATVRNIRSPVIINILTSFNKPNSGWFLDFKDGQKNSWWREWSRNSR